MLCPICGEYITITGYTKDDRLIASCGDAFNADRMHLTLAEISQANHDKGFHFFDRKTLRFFGETMKSYYLCKGTGNKIIIKRLHSKAGRAFFEFNPITCNIDKMKG
jgi:hypothetical protein